MLNTNIQRQYTMKIHNTHHKIVRAPTLLIYSKYKTFIRILIYLLPTKVIKEILPPS